jgi:hypothetical protein
MTKSQKLVFIIIFAAIFIVAIFITAFLLQTNDSKIHTKINSLSTWLLTMLTFTYVVLTYFILNSNKKLIEEQNRPYVVLSFPTEGIKFYLSIQNIGNRPAYNVKIQTKPSLAVLLNPNRGEFENTIEPLLNQDFLVPKYDIRNKIAVTQEVFNLGLNFKKFDIDISYQNSNGQKFRETYHMNLANELVERKSLQEKSIQSHLKDINDTLTKNFGAKQKIE